MSKEKKILSASWESYDPTCFIKMEGFKPNIKSREVFCILNPNWELAPPRGA